MISLTPPPKTQRTSPTSPPLHHPLSTQSSSTPLIPLSSPPKPHCPHRNDEIAITLIPTTNAHPPLQVIHPRTLILETDDPEIRIWAPLDAASSRDLDSIREDVLARLMDRIEANKKRLATSPILRQSHLHITSSPSLLPSYPFYSIEHWAGDWIVIVKRGVRSRSCKREERKRKMVVRVLARIADMILFFFVFGGVWDGYCAYCTN